MFHITKLLLCFTLFRQLRADGVVRLKHVLEHVAELPNYNVKVISEKFSNTDYESSFNVPFELMTGFASLPKPFCSNIDSTFMEVKRDKNPDFYIIEATSLEFLKSVLEAFNATITRCHNEIRPGVYWNVNVFMFLMPDSNSTEMQGEVFSDSNVRVLRNVAVLEMKGSNSILVKVFNIYENSTQHTTVLSLDSSLKTSLAEIFPDLNMNGYVLRVTSMPFSYWTSADFNVFAQDPRRLFTNRKGSEILALENICQRLNCKLDYFNTVNMVWGSTGIEATTGVFAELLYDLTDIVTANLLTYNRFRVVQPSLGILTKNFLGIVGQKPKPTRSTFDLLRPFELNLWLCLIASIIVAPISFAVLGRLDVLVGQRKERNIGDSKSRRASLVEAFWFTFGTLMGENVYASDSNQHSMTLKFVVVSWFMFAFLLTASYGGNLRAILLAPDMSKPITTLEGVIDSGLPWSLPKYGDEMDYYMANSPDPIIQKFWNENTPLDTMKEYQHEKLMEVYEGKAVYIDYNTIIDIAIKAGFTRSNGVAELYMSANFFRDVSHDVYIFAWFFQKMNPWIERFDKYLYYAYDSGLSHEWIKRASNDLVLKYKKVSPPLPIEDEILKMRMEENSGIFYLFLVLVGINVVFMVIETTWANRNKFKTSLVLMRYKIKAMSMKIKINMWNVEKG